MRALMAIAFASLLLTACAEMKPGSVSHARREIPPGPGLFTGKQGEFVVFRAVDRSADDAAADREAAD